MEPHGEPGTQEASSIGKNFKEFVPTVRDWSGSLGGTFDYMDQAQKAVIDEFLASGTGAILAASFVADSGLTLSGNIIPTSMPVGATHGGKITVTFNFQGTGELANSNSGT